MMTAIATGIIVFLVIAAFLFIARRVFRLALKLAIVVVLVLLLVAGGVYGWWQGWFGTASRIEHPAPQSNQRGNSSRRR